MKKWLLTLTLCLPLPVFAQGGEWEKINEEDGVKVFKKEIKDSPLVAFKGETVLESTMGKVLYVLIDNDARMEWVDRLAKSEILEKINEHEYMIYQQFSLPWYLTDRDYVYRGKAIREKSTGRCILSLISEDHKKAPATVGIRAQLVNSAYFISPMPGGKTVKLEVEILTDPKGWIPTWLVNLIQKSWPLKTLSGVRKQLTKSGIKEFPLPPLQDDVKKDEVKKDDKAAAPKVEPKVEPPKKN